MVGTVHQSRFTKSRQSQCLATSQGTDDEPIFKTGFWDTARAADGDRSTALFWLEAANTRGEPLDPQLTAWRDNLRLANGEL